MMSIRFKCSKCSHSLQVPDEHAGRKAKCPNCAEILPIPAPAQAQPSAKSEPAVPAAPSSLGPSAAGPIPSLAKKKKPSKAKPKQPSQLTQPPQDLGKPSALRSGKKAIIVGLAIVAVLVLVVVAWKMDWFSSEKETPKPQARRTTRRARTRIAKKPAISVEILREQIDQMELRLATLEKLLVVKSAVPGLDQNLVGAFNALEKLSRQIQGQPLARTNFNQLLSQNKKWLYEKVLARAKTLVGQYRFTSAKELLKQILPSGAVTSSSDTGSETSPRSARRGPRSFGASGWLAAQQDCRRFANSKLIKRGLAGEICLWTREESDEFGQPRIALSLDAPPEPLRIARRQDQSQQKWQQKWGPASEHLSFIRKLQSQAESQQDIARAGRLYAIIRDLENRSVTFETPAQADAQLMNLLARRKADHKAQQKILALIGRCRYQQALQSAQQRIKLNPTNPDNYHSLLRCYLESYNASPLEIDSALLLSHAQKMAELSKYDVPNNLLALSLASIALPQGPGISVYRDFIHNRTSLLQDVSGYAGRYQPVIDWMKGENRDMVLRDFEYKPFLAGEPVDLLDAQGLLYTLYSSQAPPGRAALILVRRRSAQQQRGLTLHMPNGQQYQLWNIYPPTDSSDLDTSSVASLSEPILKPVLELSSINPSELIQLTSIPVINSSSLLRCQQDSEGRRSGWRLRIPRAALNREQLGPEKSRPTTRRPRPSRSSRSTARNARPSLGSRLPGSSRSPTRRRSSRTPGEQDNYIWINFSPSGTGGRGATADDQGQSMSRVTAKAQVRPITCLVRSGRGEIAYFNDAKGDYLIGLDGKRLYAEKNQLLRTLNQEGPNWYLALDAKAYPDQLQRLMTQDQQPTAQRRLGEPDERGRTTDESRRPPPRPARLTVAEAASWLSSLAAQSSAPLGRRSSPGRRTRTVSSPVIGRWLIWQGTSIAQLDGQIIELGGNDFAEPMFHTAQAGADLLNTANTYYQTSLQDWPTLAGEVYKETNKSRLSRLMGRDASAIRSLRTQRLTSIDVTKASLRAEGLLVAGDSNQAIAIYADLIGFLSLQLQQAITQDLLSTGQADGGLSNRPESSLFPGPDRSSYVDQRALQEFGAIPSPARSRRAGRSRSPDSRKLPPQEQFFVDADLLIKASAGRAAALEQADLLAQARQSLRQSSSRIRAYLLTELTEFIERRRAQRTPISPQLKQIMQSWQAISQKKSDATLTRALQAAQGQAITTPWPSSTPAVSTRPSKPPMSLAAWLDIENADLSPLEPERLLLAAQFSWIRESITLEQTEPDEPLVPSQRAERIIKLVQTYQSGAPAQAPTAEALWQLGSFMAAMGYQAEAWDCLGQAGALYSQLALALLPEVLESRGRAGLSQQRHYYTYRTAALAALAEAAAFPADEPVSTKSSAMLVAEIHAKFLQLRRAWSLLTLGSEEPPAILSTASHTLPMVRNLTEAKAYAQPRMRFWWWYYPPELAQKQPSAPGRRTARPGRNPLRSRDSSQRPKLEYVETKQRAKPGQRSRPRGPGSPEPLDSMFLPTPGSRLGI